MKRDYVCRFCAKPGSVVYGDSPTEMLAADAWFRMLCCDRCGDFRIAMREVKRKMQHVVIQIINAPRRGSPEHSKLMASAGEYVSELTKKITTLVCDFYRVQNIWDRDFAAQIMEKPNKSDIIIKAYIGGVARFSRQK